MSGSCNVSRARAMHSMAHAWARSEHMWYYMVAPPRALEEVSCAPQPPPATCWGSKWSQDGIFMRFTGHVFRGPALVTPARRMPTTW